MSRKKTGREGLLVWLQSRISGYRNVNVVDFTDSWVDGMHIIQEECEFKVKYEELQPAARVQNLEFAFSLAEKLGISRLIEPTDMLVESGPNKFSVITYLAQFVDQFRRQEYLEAPIQRYEPPPSTSLVQEAEHKLRIRSTISKRNTTRFADRVNMSKAGMVAGKIRELKRFSSTTRQAAPERKRGGTVTERVAEFNRRTGSHTTHVAGDTFISERVPSGLVADRIATFIKLHRQIQLDIEFIMVMSPKMQRGKRRDGQPQTPPGQLMSNIYYVMRQGETTSDPNMNDPSDVHHPIVEPIEL